MFSFFREAPSTLFDVCPAFEKIRPLISSLFAKETELKNAAAEPGLARQKYRAISDLCENIRILQNEFNQAAKECNADITKQLIIIFANQLRPIINDILTDDSYVLRRHRDAKKRELSRTIIDVGTHAAVIAPAAVMGSPAIAVSMTAGSITGFTSFITTPIRQGLYYATGLSKHKQTKSMELLNDLASAIEEMVQHYQLEPKHAAKVSS